MQIDYFKLDILSPVHIGTGDELDPMHYLMHKEEGRPCCHVLDPVAWASDYPDPDELAGVFSGDNVPAMRTFLANHIDPAIYGLRRIAVSTPGIFEQYESKLRDRRTTHQLLFSPQMTSAGRIPLIPGSAIKGAIRTAVIDWLDREKNLKLKNAANWKDYENRLQRVLGDISGNAFKQLKISDVTGYADSTLLVAPLEIRRNPGRATTPKSTCEVLPSHLLGRPEACALHAKTALGNHLTSSDHRLTLPGGQSWTWPQLAELVNRYYRQRHGQEQSRFYGLPHFAEARNAMAKIGKALEAPDPGQMILRVGRYCQIEFVTVQHNRPKTRKGQSGTPLPAGTTRTLANGNMPFGWIRLTPCSATDYQNGLDRCKTANQAVQEQRRDNRQRILTQRQQQIAAERRRAQEQQEEARAAAARQAELDAMSQDERDLFLLERGELNDNQVYDLFNRLDALPPQLQQQVAAALKARCIAQKRWRKKECSKKQAAKVDTLKKILEQDR